MARVTHVNVGAARPAPGDSGKETGIYKEPVEFIWVGPLGVADDTVCDRRHHGGPSKAVCVYPADHYRAWRASYPALDWPPGSFGENVTVAKLDEAGVHLGDVFEVGQALVQVSQPRQPCGTLSARHGIPELAKVATSTGRTGWYLRVLRAGVIRPGDEWRLVQADPSQVSVAQANAARYGEPDADALAAVLAVGALSETWREDLAERWERAVGRR